MRCAFCLLTLIMIAFVAGKRADHTLIYVVYVQWHRSRSCFALMTAAPFDVAASGESQLKRCCAYSPAVPSCLAQDDPYDTPYPANYTGPRAEPVPTSASDGWHFPRPLFTAADTYLTAGSAGQGFTAVACGSTYTAYLVSYRMSYTPEGLQDYAVHLSLLTPYPNNITGTNPANQLTLAFPFKSCLACVH